MKELYKADALFDFGSVGIHTCTGSVVVHPEMSKIGFIYGWLLKFIKKEHALSDWQS